MLKRLTVLAAAAAVLLAVPVHAEAAKKKHAAKHKRTHVTHVARQGDPAHRGTNLFPAGPLYYNGDVYMGDDPDPFIRSQLWRDMGRFGGEAN
jgi:hypothetical protein